MNREDVVGFDYAQAILELNQRYTYEQIAKAIGYDSKNSIWRILRMNQIPSHIQGEALWDLYVDTFGKKPKFRTANSTPLSV